jgi:hypothetical protein
MRELTIETSGDARETGLLMHRMTALYHTDMLPWCDCTICEIFDIVKNLPYHEDPPDREYLQRPYMTMNQWGLGGDCDDKSICIGSWATLHGLPYRYVAVRAPGYLDLHHVFPEVYTRGNWIPLDATYNFNTLGQERERYDMRVII